MRSETPTGPHGEQTPTGPPDQSDERVSDRAHREARLSSEQLPRIVRDLRSGREMWEIANGVASDTGVAEVTAYRWVHYIDTRYQSARRRIAVAGAACLWAAVFLALGGGAVYFLGDGGLSGGIRTDAILFGVAAAVAVPAGVLSLGASKLAQRRTANSNA